jgi:SAM-dependent methyltransferase
MKSKDLLKFVAWDIINPFILNLKKNKKYSFPENYNGINLGCGLENPDKWVGIDGGFTNYVINKYPYFIAKQIAKGSNLSQNQLYGKDYFSKIKKMHFLHHELNHGVPYEDNSVPNIYSSHFFEHLFKDQAIELLKECFRVTQPGGMIRICVPCLEEEVGAIQEAINKYKSGEINDIQHFVTVNQEGYVPAFSNHRWMYDFAEMAGVLKGIGYTDIKRCTYQTGDIQDVEILDTRDGLFIEATKAY